MPFLACMGVLRPSWVALVPFTPFVVLWEGDLRPQRVFMGFYAILWGVIPIYTLLGYQAMFYAFLGDLGIHLRLLGSRNSIFTPFMVS